MTAGWVRSGPDTLARGIYRIEKSHIHRLLADPAPIYHAHAGFAFLGSFSTAETARAYCDEHEREEAATPC